jgi:predicted AlkP superfamily pyrophosphatase or phosphodiesterase
MEKKIVLVLLDACRGDYISMENTPFLDKLSKDNRYYKSLVPGFGFCERTEILVGKNTLESGYFTAFGRCFEKSPYKKFRLPLLFLETIEKLFSSIIISRLIRRFIWELVKNKDGSFYPFRIPLSKLSNFSLTEDGLGNLITSSDESLYNVASKVFRKGSTSLDSKLIGSDQSRLNLVVKNINGPCDFFPTYVSILDSIGHKDGPHSMEMKKALGELDKKLEVFYNKLQVLENPPVIVFCGDHGMSPIKETLNIKKIADKIFLNKSVSDHFDMFLDSTMARFWFNNNIKTEMYHFKDLLEKNFKNKGVFLFQNEYEDYGIPNSNLYGDCIWICNDGFLISPDFFTPSNKILNGMHGYLPKSNQHYGFAIIAGKNVKKLQFLEPIPLKRIYYEIKFFFSCN